jgi:hypothetical protein
MASMRIDRGNSVQRGRKPTIAPPCGDVWPIYAISTKVLLTGISSVFSRQIMGFRSIEAV